MKVDCAPLLVFQINIARNWHSRAESSYDLFAKFFFCFSGFNALYFAWAQADDLKNKWGNKPSEGDQIENLLRKLDSEAEEILGQLSPAIEFFSSRDPIQQMGTRTCSSFIKGKEERGRHAREGLASSSPVERLVALGEIVYLVDLTPFSVPTIMRVWLLILAPS